MTREEMEKRLDDLHSHLEALIADYSKEQNRCRLLELEVFIECTMQEIHILMGKLERAEKQ